MKEVICRQEMGGGIFLHMIYEPVQELVRCKDCKHHGEWSCAVCINELFETADNWYCADGERKEVTE